jgi:hypothetical protein
MMLGGVRPSVIEEGRTMMSFFVLLFLILCIVYTSRIPPVWFQRFRNPLWQFVGFVLVFGISDLFGWSHGILAALVFALLLSHAYVLAPRTNESFVNYIIDKDCKKDSRWFSERVLGENPFLIREITAPTSAIQDYSEKNMNSSHSSK